MKVPVIKKRCKQKFPEKMVIISNPENISNVDLILSANRALLCEIRPNMRKITIEYLKKEKKIIIFFYYDVPPSEDELDYDVFGTITAEMGCDFPNEISFEEKIIVIPFPNELPQNGISVYRRYESFPQEQISEDSLEDQAKKNTLLQIPKTFRTALNFLFSLPTNLCTQLTGSRFSSQEEVNEETSKKKGTKSVPYPGYQEVVDFGEHIGIWKSSDGKFSFPTTVGVIHYSKKGAHIIPDHPYKTNMGPIEGIPSPENITKTDLVMSANRALLGEIRPTMRAIYIEYLKNERKINLHFYYDSPPCQEELDCDLFGAISAEMSCDFPNEISFEEKIIILSYPNRLPQKGICVYNRYELPPPEEEEV